MCNLFVFSSSPFALRPRPRAPSYTLSSIVLPISSPAYFTSHIISVRLSPSPLSPTCPYFTSRSHSVIQKYLGDNLVCIQPGRDLHRRHNVAVAGMPCMRPHPASKPLHTQVTHATAVCCMAHNGHATGRLVCDRAPPPTPVMPRSIRKIPPCRFVLTCLTIVRRAV